MKLTNSLEVEKLIHETEFILNTRDISGNTKFKSVILELNISLLKLKIYLLEVELNEQSKKRDAFVPPPFRRKGLK